jgi:hypothetical protein
MLLAAQPRVHAVANCAREMTCSTAEATWVGQAFGSEMRGRFAVMVLSKMSSASSLEYTVTAKAATSSGESLVAQRSVDHYGDVEPFNRLHDVHTRSKIGHSDSDEYSGCTCVSLRGSLLRLCQKTGIPTAEAPGTSEADPATNNTDAGARWSWFSAI